MLIAPSISMQMLVLVGVCALLIAGASARNDNGNFLDDKWLTGRWDKFRDVSAALLLPNSGSSCLPRRHFCLNRC